MPTEPMLVQLAKDAMRRLHLNDHDILYASVEGNRLVLQLASERGLINARVKVRIPRAQK